jgi:hypothetical protein
MGNNKDCNNSHAAAELVAPPVPPYDEPLTWASFLSPPLVLPPPTNYDNIEDYQQQLPHQLWEQQQGLPQQQHFQWHDTEYNADDAFMEFSPMFINRNAEETRHPGFNRHGSDGGSSPLLSLNSADFDLS